MIVLQILLAAVVLGLIWWLWEMNGRSRAVGLIAVAAAVAFLWPWAVAADWASVARTALIGAAAGAVVLAYARLIGRVRARAEARDRE